MSAVKWIVGSAVVIGLGLAAIAQYGAEKQARLQRALILTGGAVGMTEGQLDELALSVATEKSAPIGDSREVLYWLVCSGQVGPSVVRDGLRAGLLLMRAQGVDEQEAVRRLLTLGGRSTADPLAHCPR